MEGPSLLIIKADLKPFKGKTVEHASGLSKLDYDRLIGNKLIDIKSWGKHLLLQFKKVTVRIHFLMFGSYRINERKVTEPRLRLQFDNGEEVNFYTTAVTYLEGNLDDIYDWSTDVLNKNWDEKKARKKLKQNSDMNVSDALLDQQIFAGVGNIIKNEVLFRIHIHPESLVSALPPRKLTELIREARQYSFDFYEWKKIYQLKKHWLIYTKKKCPRCKLPALKEYIGKTPRRTFFCANCQKLYQ
jgi:endonuclease VIII